MVLRHEWVQCLVLFGSGIDVSWLCDTYLFPKIKAAVQSSFNGKLSEIQEALTLDEVAFREAPDDKIAILVRSK